MYFFAFTSQTRSNHVRCTFEAHVYVFTKLTITASLLNTGVNSQHRGYKVKAQKVVENHSRGSDHVYAHVW